MKIFVAVLAFAASVMLVTDPMAAANGERKYLPPPDPAMAMPAPKVSLPDPFVTSPPEEQKPVRPTTVKPVRPKKTTTRPTKKIGPTISIPDTEGVTGYVYTKTAIGYLHSFGGNPVILALPIREVRQGVPLGIILDPGELTVDMKLWSKTPQIGERYNSLQNDAERYKFLQEHRVNAKAVYWYAYIGRDEYGVMVSRKQCLLLELTLLE